MLCRHWLRLCLALATSVAILAIPASADDAEAARVFDALFGAELRRVESTNTPDDDLTLAQQMLEAAAAEQATPVFIERVCEAAFRLGARTNSADGYDIASRAMQLLAKRVPEQARRAGHQHIAALQQAYIASTGEARTQRGQQLLDALVAQSYRAEEAEDYDDAIATLRRAQSLAGALRSDQRASIGIRLEQLRYQQKIQARIDEARDRLKRDQRDSDAAHTLVELLVVERDRPEAALPQADLLDEAIGERVKLAARAPESLNADQAMTLGDWYYALAGEAVGPARINMMARAQQYYQRYIEQEPGEGLQQVKVKVALQRIEAELGEAAVKNTRPDPADAPANQRWPVLREGLAFAWEDAGHKNVRFEPRGQATMNDAGRLDVTDGSVLVHGVNDRLLQMCARTHQLTIEAVVEPASTDQEGPARIVTFSVDSGSRNFTLGQERTAFNIRLRTTETGANGMLGAGDFGQIENAGQRFHVLITYAPGRLMAYVNGQLALDRNDVAGDFANWEPSQLVLGDEFKDTRNWNGSLSHIAIYNRALLPAQVARHWAAVRHLVEAGDE